MRSLRTVFFKKDPVEHTTFSLSYPYVRYFWSLFRKKEAPFVLQTKGGFLYTTKQLPPNGSSCLLTFFVIFQIYLARGGLALVIQ